MCRQNDSYTKLLNASPNRARYQNVSNLGRVDVPSNFDMPIPASVKAGIQMKSAGKSFFTSKFVQSPRLRQQLVKSKQLGFSRYGGDF